MTHRRGRKICTSIELSKKKNLAGRINIQIRSRKESSVINSANQQISKIKKGEVSTYFSIITLNVNGLKRCGRAEWIKKQDSTIFSLQKTYFTGKDKTQTQSGKIEKCIPSKQNPKTSGSSCTHIRQSRLQVRINQKG
jgi:hypothetical protein